MTLIDHHVLIKPHPDNVIWRYLDLEKFESILKDKSLFFCRSDKFSDPFEGTIPKKEFDFRVQTEIHHAKEKNLEITYQEALEKTKPLSGLHKRFRRSFIINCWHINKGESDAMWRLYLKTNEGVAIQSTVHRLCESLKEYKESMFISNVRYLDYENDIWYDRIEFPIRGYNLFTPIIHKRKAFIHESELRIFQQLEEAVDNDNYWDDKPNYIGKLIPCDIENLIDKIILPPTSDSIVSRKVEELIKKYNFNFDIEKSKLIDEPYY